MSTNHTAIVIDNTNNNTPPIHISNKQNPIIIENENVENEIITFDKTIWVTKLENLENNTITEILDLTDLE